MIYGFDFTPNQVCADATSLLLLDTERQERALFKQTAVYLTPLTPNS